jgi:hypothetical protein
MNKSPVCDFCGRSQTTFPYQSLAAQGDIEMDEDGLWVCSECKTRLKSKSRSCDAQEDNELDEKLKALVGKSAGAICRTLHLPYVPPYQSIIDAASAIAYDEDRYMSEWLFITQWIDGTTVWQSEDRCFEVLVSPDASIQVQART